MAVEWQKKAEAENIENALESVIAQGKILTKDLGGSATTKEFTDEIISKLI